MMPIGPLMIEHRLIEKIIEIIRMESIKLKKGKPVDESFIDTIVDFIQIYADKTHHGKEEDILFKDLGKKSISDYDKKIMGELLNEHISSRNIVTTIIGAKTIYFKGDDSELYTITQMFDALIDLYTEHIKKEDKVFFPSAMGYFNQEEQESMLNEMFEFDRKMIHAKYRSVVEILKS